MQLQLQFQGNMYKPLLLFVFVFYVVAGYSYSHVRDLEELKYIADVDGKEFYSKSKPPFLNWTQAGLLCEEHGMQLASITSIDQLNSLKSAAKNGTLIHAHWTSGRDAHSPRQFLWNTTNTEVSSNLGFNFVGTDNHKGYQSCLIFMGFNGNDLDSNLDWRTCHNRHRTLCETKYCNN